MKQTLKGVLCSAFICPGAGHLALREKRRGWCYVALATLSIGVFIWQLVPQVHGIVSEIAASSAAGGAAAGDVTELSAQIRERVLAADTRGLAWSIRAFAVIWIIALIDVALLGRRRDRQVHAATQ